MSINTQYACPVCHSVDRALNNETVCRDCGHSFGSRVSHETKIQRESRIKREELIADMYEYL